MIFAIVCKIYVKVNDSDAHDNEYI